MAEWPADQPAELGKKYLTSGATLDAGQWLSSPNDTARALLQTDGNFVVYKKSEAEILPAFSLGIAGGKTLANQADDNLVLYAEGGAVAWASGTTGPGGAYLTVTDEGELVYTSNGLKLWDSVVGPAAPDTPSDIPPPPADVPLAVVEEPVAPIEPAPVEEAPVAPLEEAPAAPIEEAPVAPLEEVAAAPIEEAPVAAVEEAPVAHVEESPVEVPAPVEEVLAPVEVAPVEEAAPAEEGRVLAEEVPAVPEIPTNVSTIAEQAEEDIPAEEPIAAVQALSLDEPTPAGNSDGAVEVTSKIVEEWDDNGTQLYKHDILMKNVGQDRVVWAQIELPIGMTWQTWTCGDKEDGVRILHLPQYVLDNGGLHPGEEFAFGAVFNTNAPPLVACHVETAA